MRTCSLYSILHLITTSTNEIPFSPLSEGRDPTYILTIRVVHHLPPDPSWNDTHFIAVPLSLIGAGALWAPSWELVDNFDCLTRRKTNPFTAFSQKSASNKIENKEIFAASFTFSTSDPNFLLYPFLTVTQLSRLIHFANYLFRITVDWYCCTVVRSTAKSWVAS